MTEAEKLALVKALTKVSDAVGLVHMECLGIVTVGISNDERLAAHERAFKAIEEMNASVTAFLKTVEL